MLNSKQHSVHTNSEKSLSFRYYESLAFLIFHWQEQKVPNQLRSLLILQFRYSDTLSVSDFVKNNLHTFINLLIAGKWRKYP